jgi:hypothetical protein
MTALTLTHVALSLIGIASGFVVIGGLITAKQLDRWTVLFLASTILTSVSGFFFPADHFTPGHAVGILSLLVLGPAVWARYREQMAGRWRITYAICAMIAQYFNFAVLVIQSFDKVPALKALAPSQSEPPFVVTQLVVLALFVALTIAAAMRFRDPSNYKPKAPTNVAALS